MRFMIIALLLALLTGSAYAVSLQGSDANATVVLFGSARTPVADENSTLEILKLDVGLVGSDNASYELMDQNNTVYYAGLYKPLSSGILPSGALTAKQTIYFLTEKDSLFKLINVTPDGEAPIYINWWATPKANNSRLTLRYYGIWDSSINSDEQAVIVQVRVKNNGSESIYVSPENFTLIDQWGWPYRPTLGFDAENVTAGGSTERVLVGFTGISSSSRPSAIAYDFGAPDQITIDFEMDYVPLSDEVVYGAAASNATASAAASSSPSVAAPSVTAPSNATTAVATTAAAAAPGAKVASENATAVGSSIKDRVAASQARLAAMKDDLDQQTPEEGNGTESASG